jgi:hypothetical protein
MTGPTRLAAMSAAMAWLAFTAPACSPKPSTSDQALATAADAHTGSTPMAAASDPAPLAAGRGASALPGPCQSLLASMGTCADNLTRQGSPLGGQIRLSVTDMRNSIAGAPPAEVSDFCATEAAAFRLRAEASHCQ